MREVEMRPGNIRPAGLKPVELREGATISGAMHVALLALLLFGTDFLSARDSAPLNITEVELIDGSEFDAAVSAAPVVPQETPEELQPEVVKDETVAELPAPDVAIELPDMPSLASDAEPDDTPPDLSALLIPPPPTSVVTEPPRASIAEIPSPDEVLHQAPTPESAPSTEPVQALAAAPKPESAPRAPAPPEPEPVAEPQTEPDLELAEQPEPEAEIAAAPEAPDPEEQAAEDPGETAPLGPAPREAKLPVAKPADKAAAALAARKPDPAVKAPEPNETEAATEPKPAEPAATASSQFANIVTVGEKDALRLGIKRYFVYNGNRSDRSLQVTIRIKLANDASIVGKPELIDAGGGDQATQQVLFRSGRRALLRAEAAGEFKKLPAEKYDGWKLIHVTFTPEEIGFST